MMKKNKTSDTPVYDLVILDELLEETKPSRVARSKKRKVLRNPYDDHEDYAYKGFIKRAYK